MMIIIIIIIINNWLSTLDNNNNNPLFVRAKFSEDYAKQALKEKVHEVTILGLSRGM